MITRRLVSTSLVAGLLAIAFPTLAASVHAATKKKTDEKPKDATAQCVDGSYSRAKTQQGACSSHGGVKTWFGETASAPVPPSPERVSTSKRAPTPSKAAKAPSTTSKAAPPPSATSAPEPTTLPPAATSSAKAPTVATTTATPANAIAKCKDGTFSYAKTHSGACSHHGGVAEWYK